MKKILISIIILAFCAGNAFASPENEYSPQRAPLTISGSSMTIKGLIELIERETNYLFVYSEDDINLNEPVNVTEGKMTVADCLNGIFPEKGLAYYFEKNYIILTSQQPNIISIYGKVIDSSNREPLAFATVSLKESKISNVTNGEGIFLLKFPDTFASDSVFISYLGFEIAKYAVVDLLASEGLKVSPNIIALKSTTMDIPPITIRAADALTIVNESISKIKDNYPDKPMQMTSFYREMIKKGSNYVTLTEAVLDVNKAPYNNSFSSDQVGIYKGRGSVDRQRLDTLLIKFKGGINSAFDLDVMKYPFLSVSPFELRYTYDFTFDHPVIINDKVNYVINFNQKDTITDILFRGKLYIETESLALTRAEFNMNVENNPRSASLFIKKMPIGLRINILYAKYLVQYKEVDGKYTFDYSRTELKFDSKWNRKLFKTTYTIVSEMAVTDRSDQKIKIPNDQKVRSNDIAIDKVSDFNDDNFWKDYNVIEPESGIENIINRIVKQLKRKNR